MINVPSICHLTILNPAIHTRIFYKLALSQVKLGYDVMIYGQDELSTPYVRNKVHIHPISPFSRLGFKRLLAPFNLLIRSLRNKADIYTIHTPELLWVGWLLKKLTRCKLIYDAHEDYEKNIIHGGYYSPRLKSILVFLLRLNHRFFLSSFDAISYAEISYDNILGFAKDRVFILRNTFSEEAVQGTSTIILPQKNYLLFSGTIAAQWGIWESLEIWKKMRTEIDIEFVLAGFTYDKKLLSEINAWVERHQLQSDFTLIGGASYVPYVDILHLLKHCYASLGLYRLKSYIQGKIPTKFYEAMAFQKPILFTKDPFWNELNQQWNFGIACNDQTSGAELASLTEAYYKQEIKHPQAQYSWEEDEREMSQMLDQLQHKV